MTPKVSVLIPTYNYGHILDETIGSVLSQTLPDFELIIVDDCSSDDTDVVVAKYLNDKRIRYYKNENNLGLVGNWNRCLEYASGEYIKFLCADDKFHPQILEKMVAVMDEYPTVSVVSCQKQLFGANNRVFQVPLKHFQPGSTIIYATLKYYNWLGEPTLVMFRKSNLHVGGFRNYTWVIDWEMWIRQLSVGDCYIIPEVLCYCRSHAGQVTSYVFRHYIDKYEEYQLVKQTIKDKKYKIDLKNVTFDREIEPIAVNDAMLWKRYVDAPDLKGVLKRRAEICTKLMFALLLKLHKKEKRMAFINMTKVAFSERVFLSTMTKTITKRFRRES